MTRYFSYKFIAFLTLLSIIFTNVDAISDLPPVSAFPPVGGKYGLPPAYLRAVREKCPKFDEDGFLTCSKNIIDTVFVLEKKCPNSIDGFRACSKNIVDSFIKEEKQFSKENPNKTFIDFTIKKCKILPLKIRPIFK